MKRDFLESLNISGETADAIMAESGKAVERLKGKISELEEKLSCADELKRQNDELIAERDRASDEAGKVTERLCRARRRYIHSRLTQLGIKDSLSDYITEYILSETAEEDADESYTDQAVSDFAEKFPQLFESGIKANGRPVPVFSRKTDGFVKQEESFSSRFGYLKRS